MAIRENVCLRRKGECPPPDEGGHSPLHCGVNYETVNTNVALYAPPGVDDGATRLRFP